MNEDGQAFEIERTDGPSGGAYRLSLEGSVAEMTFSRAGAHMIIIDHTEVPDALRGRRIGDRLVARAVSDAREQGFKIFPLCPFAAAQFRKHQDYQDVLSR
jgi:predicted GNAT family acetyltransferase